ncbi:TetR family transcriptional regulator C-terminal domain-containing protein [Roseibium algae]|uniref:TetR family transcriptional regulator C-terminal domain-containing protein n=1 Tax=Roseibium algae TaxID=3123038 RepID=A0ABU8TI00_9HYPH
MSRKSFRRLSEDIRRRNLVEATLKVVEQHGLHGATVRKVADHAGVSAGLIRHYFSSKDELVRAAYAYLTGLLTSDAAQSALQAGTQSGAAPDIALSRFIEANVTPPNLSGSKVSLWATFIGRVRSEPGYSEIHRESYRDFLELLETLIYPVLAGHGRPMDPATCQIQAIALNGLIDGLWLEGSLDHGLYNTDRLPAIALTAAEGILRLPDGTLSRHQTSS